MNEERDKQIREHKDALLQLTLDNELEKLMQLVETEKAVIEAIDRHNAIAEKLTFPKFWHKNHEPDIRNSIDSLTKAKAVYYTHQFSPMYDGCIVCNSPRHIDLTYMLTCEESQVKRLLE